MKNIYFDESGNTGYQLLDKEQLIYVLASTDYEVNESEEILRKYFSNVESLHFKELKKYSKGKIEIIKFLTNEINNIKKRFHIYSIHKRYLLVVQLLEYLLEPQLYDAAIDYYDRGCNIVLSSLIYLSLPTVCNNDVLSKVYKQFIKMFRTKNQEDINTFYKSLIILYKSCQLDDSKKNIMALINSKNNKSILESISSHSTYVLDPSIHALIGTCGYWSEKYSNGFNVCHDRSNTIDNQKDRLVFLSSQNIKDIKLGYGKVKQTYPYKVKNIQFLDSATNYSIKLCDIVSGIFYYYTNQMLLSNKKSDSLFESIKDLSAELVPFTKTIFPLSFENGDLNEIINERKKMPGDINPIDFFTLNNFK